MFFDIWNERFSNFLEFCDKIKYCHLSVHDMVFEFFSGNSYNFCANFLIIWKGIMYDEVKFFERFDDEKIHDNLVEIFIRDSIFEPISNKCFSKRSFYLHRFGDNVIVYDDTIWWYSYEFIIHSSEESNTLDIFFVEKIFYNWFYKMSSLHHSRRIYVLKWCDFLEDHRVH